MVTLSVQPSVLFDFIFNPYALLSIWAVIVNSILIYLIINKGRENTANRWFIFVLFTLVTWGLFEFLSRSSNNPFAASFWDNSAMVGWAFVAPIFLGFTLTYIGKEKLLSSYLLNALLFGPSFVFLLLGWMTNLINNHNLEEFRRVFYGWEVTSAPLFWSVIAWIDLLFVIALLLLFKYWLWVKDRDKKRQTAFFIIAVLIPIIGGSVTNGLLPILGFTVFPAAIILTSAMSLIITFAILKYNLFVINPATVIANIVETMNEILIVFNPNHVIEFVNPAVEKVLGYRQEDIVGKSFKNLLRGNWEIYHRNLLAPVHENKVVSGVDLELISAEGENIPVSFSATPLKDDKGNMFGIVGVATDIRKIRDLFADITAERNKLTTTVESIADGVIALDLDGKVTTINPAALEMFSLSEKDIIGKNIDSLLKIFDGDRKIFAKDFVPKIKLEKDTIVYRKENLKIITSFNKQVFVNLIASAIREGEEVGLGVIITMNDVSKEKELEEMKLDFVSMAAHELRTPLTAIRGYLSVLQEEISKNLSSEQKSFLDKAFISSSQLAALVENLLSVSRIERGAMRIEAEAQGWKSILEQVVTNYLPLSKEKGIKLTFACPDKLPKVLVDKFRISEVLSNLIGNALSYTESGGSVEISAQFNDKEDKVVTYIRDTGQGIPKSALPHLFTKFFRVSGVLEQGSKGTGLGLYISKAIVNMHGGDIWVSSILGKGSTFSFTIPTASVYKSVNKAALPSKPKRTFKRKKATQEVFA